MQREVMHGPETIAGDGDTVPEYEKFSLGLRTNSQHTIEIQKIMQSVEGGGLTVRAIRQRERSAIRRD